MTQLPSSVSFFKKSPVFTNENVPEALLNDHRTSEGVWGVVNIVKGSIKCFMGDNPNPLTLTPAEKTVVEPKVPHRVELTEPAEFFVEFYK